MCVRLSGVYLDKPASPLSTPPQLWGFSGGKALADSLVELNNSLLICLLNRFIVNLCVELVQVNSRVTECGCESVKV